MILDFSKSSNDWHQNEHSVVIPVWPDGEVGLDAELHEGAELRGLHPAAHDVDELGGELHVGLEGQVAAGRALEHEPEVWKQGPDCID